MSNSVWKLEVGSYKDGRKRYEYRHLNDLKLAHPKSLAAPAERPTLGRPASSSTKSPTPTETSGPGTPTSEADYQNGEQVNKPVATPPTPAENSNAGGRPIRSTRNQNPLYVDAIAGPTPTLLPFPGRAGNSNVDFDLKWSPRPWSASKTELDDLNLAISGRRGPGY